MNRIESEKKRAVMRWAGPRMILYHPIEAIKHLIREINDRIENRY